MKEEAVSLKLVFAVVQNDDVKALTRALIDHEISVTRISSTGGFLRGASAGFTRFSAAVSIMSSSISFIASDNSSFFISHTAP